ncbi:unnamed protein product [Moneuplotes crassus]|uniref:Uncharacterized protein n=1 Tax=Euplotes crassus TaxID=5936 RepID=A0AAD1Y168_EUPCR|nr:unnamed protein product [Moneuplotes crassus]
MEKANIERFKCSASFGDDVNPMSEGLHTQEGFYQKNNNSDDSNNIHISEIGKFPYQMREAKGSEISPDSSSKLGSEPYIQEESQILDLKVNNQNFEEIKEEYYHNEQEEVYYEKAPDFAPESRKHSVNTEDIIRQKCNANRTHERNTQDGFQPTENIQMESYECKTPLQMSHSGIVKLNENRPERFVDDKEDFSQNLDKFTTNTEKLMKYIHENTDREDQKSKYQGYKPKIIMFKKKKKYGKGLKNPVSEAKRSTMMAAGNSRSQIDTQENRLRKAISPRQYDKVLGKYRKSQKSGSIANSFKDTISSKTSNDAAKMVFEKVTLKLDLNKTDEKEFMSNFYKEYANNPYNKEKSFMARMTEDISKRQLKEQRLKQAEVKYRRSKYGSLSRERAEQLSDRLYKDAHSKILSRSKMEGMHKTYRDFHEKGLDKSRSLSTGRAGKKKINQFLQRMKHKDDEAKKRIYDLRKEKTYTENRKVEQVLHQNISRGKMSKHDIVKLQRKFEKDIEKRKKDYEIRLKLKQKRFEDSIQGMFQPQIDKSKRSLESSRKAYSDAHSVANTMEYRKDLDENIKQAFSYFREAKNMMDQRSSSQRAKVRLERSSDGKHSNNLQFEKYLANTPKVQNTDLRYFRGTSKHRGSSSSKRIRDYGIRNPNLESSGKKTKKKLQFTDENFNYSIGSKEEAAEQYFINNGSKNSPLMGSPNLKMSDLKYSPSKARKKRIKKAPKPPKSRRGRQNRDDNNGQVPNYLSATQSSLRAKRVKHVVSETRRSGSMTGSFRSQRRSNIRNKKSVISQSSYEGTKVSNSVSRINKARATSENNQENRRGFKLNISDREKYEKSLKNFEQYKLENVKK